MLKVKNPTIGISAVFFSCMICFAVVLFIIPSNDRDTNNNNNSSTTTSSKSSVNTSLQVDRKFDFAGIKDNGVIALFGKNQQEFAAELDNKEWQNIQWSPDRKYVSVLGKEIETSKYDIFLYEIASSTWTKITPFSKANNGVSGYAWESESKILFTQGPKLDNWVHRYDLDPQEVQKLFKVSGSLHNVSDDELLIDQNPAKEKSFNLYSTNGELKYQFKAEEFADISLLGDVNFGLEDNSFVIRGNTDLGFRTKWVSLVKINNEPRLLIYDLPQNSQITAGTEADIEYVTLCGHGEVYYLAEVGESTEVMISRLDPNQNIVEEISNDTQLEGLKFETGSFTCGENGVLIEHLVEEGGSMVKKWFSIDQSNLTELLEASDYIELVGI